MTEINSNPEEHIDSSIFKTTLNGIDFLFIILERGFLVVGSSEESYIGSVISLTNTLCTKTDYQIDDYGVERLLTINDYETIPVKVIAKNDGTGYFIINSGSPYFGEFIPNYQFRETSLKLKLNNN